MNRHSTLLICGSVCLAFALGLWTSQPSSGQAALVQPPQSKVGKYQITSDPNRLFLCDTETGAVWSHTGQANSVIGWSVVQKGK